MKHLVSVVLVIVLVLDVALFVGIGFGTGALSTSTVNSGGQAQYSVIQANVGQSFGDGLSWAVTMSNVAQSGVAPITAMLPGYASTQVSFGVNGYTTGDCGNTGRPAWAPGQGSDYGYYTIQYFVNGVAQSFTAQVDGAQVSSGLNHAYSISANSSGILWYCGISLGGGDMYLTSLAQQSTVYLPHTLSFLGLMPDGKLTISFAVQWDYCDGNGGGFGNRLTGVCAAELSAAGATLDALPTTGTNHETTSATSLVLSAGASVQVLNQGALYNGGTLSVGVTTGYDGPNGYQLAVLCPQPRACGGQQDSAFPAQHVDNDILGQRTFSWAIPMDYALRSSTPLINNIVVVLIANYGVASQSLSFPVTISPTLNPGAPQIAYSSSDGSVYPAVGASLTFTVTATATNKSGPITSITLEVFYLQTGQSASSPPPCGASWVTGGCPFGQTIQVSLSATGGTGTYTFQVQPPTGAVAIGASATANAGPGSANISAPFYVQIKPANCILGSSCDPLNGNLTFWGVVGPILLFAMFLVIALLAAINLRTLKPAWARFLPLAAVVGVFSLLVVFGILGAWFHPGGFFAPHGSQ